MITILNRTRFTLTHHGVEVTAKPFSFSTPYVHPNGLIYNYFVDGHNTLVSLNNICEALETGMSTFSGYTLCLAYPVPDGTFPYVVMIEQRLNGMHTTYYNYMAANVEVSNKKYATRFDDLQEAMNVAASLTNEFQEAFVIPRTGDDTAFLREHYSVN